MKNLNDEKESQKPTDTMDILGDASMHGARKIIIDDMHDRTDIKTTSRNAGSDHKGAFAATEGTQSGLTFDLLVVSGCEPKVGVSN